MGSAQAEEARSAGSQAAFSQTEEDPNPATQSRQGTREKLNKKLKNRADLFQLCDLCQESCDALFCFLISLFFSLKRRQ